MMLLIVRRIGRALAAQCNASPKKNRMKTSDRNTGRLILVLTGTVLLSFALAIVLSEVLLRVAGFRPWVYSSKDLNEPTMVEPDAILGWQNKAGSYVVRYHPSGQAIQITLLENGRRRTRVNSTAEARQGARSDWGFIDSRVGYK